MTTSYFAALVVSEVSRVLGIMARELGLLFACVGNVGGSWVQKPLTLHPICDTLGTAPAVFGQGPGYFGQGPGYSAQGPGYSAQGPGYF